MSKRRWRVRVAVVLAIILVVAVGGFVHRAYERSRAMGEQAERDMAKGERWSQLLQKRDREGLSEAEAAEFQRLKRWFLDGMPDDPR